MTNKKHNQIMNTYKIVVPFKLNHADFPPLLNSAVSDPVSSISSCATVSRSLSIDVSALSFKYFTEASDKYFPRANRFSSVNFAPKYLLNPCLSLVLEQSFQSKSEWL